MLVFKRCLSNFEFVKVRLKWRSAVSEIVLKKKFLVVVAHLAVVHRGAGLGISHVALFHHGINDPVIGAFHPLLHPAAQKGQGIGEHWAAIGGSLQHVHPSETCLLYTSPSPRD